MRFMVIVKASKDSEAGVMPKYRIADRDGQVQRGNGQAGIMEAGEGLHPTSRGVCASNIPAGKAW